VQDHTAHPVLLKFDWNP